MYVSTPNEDHATLRAQLGDMRDVVYLTSCKGNGTTITMDGDEFEELYASMTAVREQRAARIVLAATRRCGTAAGVTA